jgi:hypothetical protein
MDPLSLGKTVDKIDSQTLPQAADLLNKVLQSGIQAINQTVTNLEACAGDAITDLDDILERRMAPFTQIVNQGLQLKGTIGGIPVDLELNLKEK